MFASFFSARARSVSISAVTSITRSPCALAFSCDIRVARLAMLLTCKRHNRQRLSCILIAAILNAILTMSFQAGSCALTHLHCLGDFKQTLERESNRMSRWCEP